MRKRDKSEREYLRNLQVVQVRPDPPRDVRFDAGVLSWTAPKNTRGITHYNVYAGDEYTLVRQIPSGQTFLNDNLSADRVFVTSYNQTNNLESVRAAYTTPVVPGGATADLPGNTSAITGVVVIRNRSGEDKTTEAFINVTGFTVPTGDFDGFVQYLEDPDQSSGTRAPLLSETADLGTTYGGGGPRWSYKDLGRWTYVAGYAPTVGPIEQRSEARTVRLYLNAYSTEAGERPLVQAGLADATASATFVIPAQTQVGGVGEEYCKNPLNPVLEIQYRTSADGVEEYQGAFGWVKPTDPRYYGCQIIAVPRGDGPTGKSPVDTDTAWESGYAPVPPRITYDFYFLGVDADGNVNSIAEGLGNKISGIVIEPQTAGSMVGDRVVNIPAASFAATIQPVHLTSGVPGVYSGDTIYDTVGRKTYIWSGTAYVRPLNGADIKLELALDKLTAGQISAGAISTTELYAGEILVGQGGGKPTRFKVVNSSGTMIGFWGDDSGVPYNGLFCNNARFAPLISSTSPRIDISGSGITITGASFSITSGGLVTEISNQSINGIIAGLACKNEASPGYYAAISSTFVGCYITGQVNPVAKIDGLGGYGQGIFTNGSGTTTITLNGSSGSVTATNLFATAAPSGSITYLKTLGGATGSITITNGIVTAFS